MADTFTIYTYATPENRVAWVGTIDDSTAPLAFIPDLAEYGPQMESGDTLTLGPWHYAVKH